MSSGSIRSPDGRPLTGQTMSSDSMKKQLARMRDALGIELIEHPQAGTLCIRKAHGLVFQITVAYDVLEWFVDARNDAGAVWSEWADYYPIDGETSEQLAQEMVDDLQRCATLVAQSEARILPGRDQAGHTLQVRVGEAWKAASLSSMSAAP